MICKICNSATIPKFKAIVLNKYEVQYFKCSRCGFLFTEEPYWLKEAYNSAINITDTGILERNLRFSKVVSVLIYFLFNKSGKFVDYAGGYGIFTRLMRDIGFDFYWQDLHCDNLLSRGFEYNPELHKDVELVTAFEVLEHLVNPAVELEKILNISKNITFSTVLLPEPVPKPEDWWYYGLEHGQHISFYSLETLRYIAAKFKLNFYSSNGLHILTNKKINPLLIKLIVKLSNYGLSTFVAKNIKSKTWDDYLLLK